MGCGGGFKKVLSNVPVIGSLFQEQPKYPSANDQYNAQLAYERQRDLDAKKAEEERAAAVATETAQKQSTFDTARSAALANALSRATGQANTLGVGVSTQPIENGLSYSSPVGSLYYSDPNMERYVAALANAVSAENAAIPNLADTPGSYFGTTTAETALADALSKARQQATTSLQSGPFQAGYQSSYIPDISDDSILEALLGQQRTTAEQAIKNARSRGLLNEQGETAAIAELNSQVPGARSTLNTIGEGALGSARSSLGSLATDAFSRAGTLGYGQNLDLGSIGQGIQSKSSELLGNLEGDIRSRLGETQLFQPTSLIQTGGVAQQQYNPGDTLAAALSARKKDEAKRRGIGTQGVF